MFALVLFRTETLTILSTKESHSPFNGQSVHYHLVEASQSGIFRLQFDAIMQQQGCVVNLNYVAVYIVLHSRHAHVCWDMDDDDIEPVWTMMIFILILRQKTALEACVKGPNGMDTPRHPMRMVRKFMGRLRLTGYRSKTDQNSHRNIWMSWSNVILILGPWKKKPPDSNCVQWRD